MRFWVEAMKGRMFSLCSDGAKYGSTFIRYRSFARAMRKIRFVHDVSALSLIFLFFRAAWRFLLFHSQLNLKLRLSASPLKVNDDEPSAHMKTIFALASPSINLNFLVMALWALPRITSENELRLSWADLHLIHAALAIGSDFSWNLV